MKALETVIGLEIHVELDTASKIFCPCKNDPFYNEPNTHVCPVCMGCVGALPLLNKKALEKTILLAHSMGSVISRTTRWDRKSYFYPDLPKGYQISQAGLPVGLGGVARFFCDGTIRSVRMNRVHLEEDAAKSLHHAVVVSDKYVPRKDRTWIDFNRSGVPLVEMVTEPDLCSPKEAKALLKEIHRLVRDLGISHADMEKGQMRCDASISLRPVGDKKLYPRVEIKNLNSFRAVESALKFERDKLAEKWQYGEYPSRAITVLWDSDKAATRPMRTKESAADYRYFPEADIPEVRLTSEEIEVVTSKKPETRLERLETLIRDGVAIDAVAAFIDYSESYWRFVRIYNLLDDDSKRKILLKLWSSAVAMLSKSMEELPFDDEEIIKLVDRVASGNIPLSSAKDILKKCKTRSNITKSMVELGKVVSAINLVDIVDRILLQEKKLVERYLNGEDKILMALVGIVMKETKGAFEGSEVTRLIIDSLKKKL